MKTIEIKTFAIEYDSIDELNKEDRMLLEKAKEAHKSAYAPYSQYYVGAAILLDTGVVVTGNNQENVATPSGLCAERVAVFAASANYPGIPIKAIAITAHAKNFIINTPVTPCGACRQVLAEYEEHHNSNIRTILMGETGKIYIIESISGLLPMMFHAKELKKNKS
ncbi:MAG: cytidine deaminase [Bacteroidales bacterium]|nr:cytidine deaminase [Bacteroidales bacterium]